ncbi:MAG TPA: hypothetical protein VFM70_00730 [Salinimicrobium sp.]|nr:hypothetical protein [Salinimicrobium sp.]
MSKGKLGLLFIVIAILSVVNFKISAQVGIGTSSPNPETSLHIESNNTGILIPKMLINDIHLLTPITTTTAEEGLLVYNTSPVTGPGFFYWNGTDEWVAVGSSGYSVQFEQSSALEASSTLGTFNDLPGLNQTITAPATGTYQIIVTAYYAAEALNDDSVSLGAGEAVISLTKNGTVLSKKILVSHSFSSGTTDFYEHGTSTTIIVNTELIAGTSYTFKVRGTEINRHYVPPGWFGPDTEYYNNINNYNDAQRATMTITFVD